MAEEIRPIVTETDKLMLRYAEFNREVEPALVEAFGVPAHLLRSPWEIDGRRWGQEIARKLWERRHLCG